MSYWHARIAHEYVRRGGVIAYPTEGVFGLGCDPLLETAVFRLLALKGRSWRQGLIVIGADSEQLMPFIGSVATDILYQVTASWPGAVTWLLPASRAVPFWLTGGRPTIGLRVPGHVAARELCRRCGPLVSTSANLHRHRPARKLLQARAQFGRAVDYFLPGQVGPEFAPSQIRDAVTGRTVRTGGITPNRR